MSELVDFLERKNFKRFNSLSNDEQIIANWALCYKELMKFNFSSFYGYDLDNIELENQMQCISSDKKGGINYFNYMYSDSYDDEDKKIDDKGDFFATLSIREALEKYCITAGDWPGIVCLLGKWYEKNIHTYQGTTTGHSTGTRQWYKCPLFKSRQPLNGTGVGDDCTAFCGACLHLYADLCIRETDEALANRTMDTYFGSSSLWSDANGCFTKSTEAVGFEIIKYDVSVLQPWDMVMGHQSFGATMGHGEIYIGPCFDRIRSYGWGSIHDGLNGHSGMPAGARYVNGMYNLIFRLKGLKKYSQQEVENLVNKFK